MCVILLVFCSSNNNNINDPKKWWGSLFRGCRLVVVGLLLLLQTTTTTAAFLSSLGGSSLSGSSWMPRRLWRSSSLRRSVFIGSSFLRMVIDGEEREDPDERLYNSDNNNNNVQYSVFDSPLGLYYYDERRPIRQHQHSSAPSSSSSSSSSISRIMMEEMRRIQQQKQQQRESLVPDVARLDPPPELPATVEALTEQAVNAIHEACGRDPTARLGFEIQGLSDILMDTTTLQQQHHNCEYSAMRQWALHLAATLSSFTASTSEEYPTTTIHTTASTTTNITGTTPSSSSSSSSTTRIPISIYCNTVRQALMASRELLWLKRIEKHHRGHDNNGESIYDRIQIRCLVGDHPMIPPDMLFQHNDDNSNSKSTQQQKKKKKGLPPTVLRGLILVVQPTDYNDEYAPPGPAVNVWTALQQLVAAAAVEGLPVVCLSPQSRHPPTPWVLRDFVPPVLSWTLSATTAVPPSTSSSRQQRRRQQQRPAVVVWHCATTQPETDHDTASRWHVYSINSSIPLDDGSSRPTCYLASCREAPSPQRLRHLVREYEIS